MEEVIHTLLNLDGAILLWIQNNIRNDILTSLFKAITRLGDRGFIWILIIIILLLSRKTRKVGILSAVALIVATSFNNIILKGIFERPRPYETVEGLTSVIGRMNSFSFPSGHTSSSFAAATILYKGLPRAYGAFFLALAVLIGCSRMYLGVHYPTDVLVGAVVGIISGILVFYFSNKLSHINRESI